MLDEHANAALILPLHKNPIVRDPLTKMFKDNPRVILTEPLSYRDLVATMYRSTLILTDSGGIQEEAPSLGKPVLVLRETTERQESIDAGVAILVGTDSDKIYEETNRLLTDDVAYHSMGMIDNPYGDGHSSGRIFSICYKLLNK